MTYGKERKKRSKNLSKRERRKSRVVAAVNTVFRRHKHSIDEYCRRLDSVGHHRIMNDSYLFVVNRALRNRSISFDTFKSGAVDSFCRSRGFTSEVVLGLPSEPGVQPEMRPADLKALSKQVGKILQTLTPLENLVYQTYLMFRNEIPQRRNKFETILKHVRERAQLHGFSPSMSKDSVEESWRSAHKKVGKKIEDLVTEFFGVPFFVTNAKSRRSK